MNKDLNDIAKLKIDVFKDVLSSNYARKIMESDLLMAHLCHLKELDELNENEYNTLCALLKDYTDTIILIFAKSNKIKCYKDN